MIRSQRASQHADVRVIAATHRDLHAGARDGTFREDLLYRLDVVRIHLPALRERRQDIPLIARHFRRQVAWRSGQPAVELLPETAAALMAYDWPGKRPRAAQRPRGAVAMLRRAAGSSPAQRPAGAGRTGLGRRGVGRQGCGPGPEHRAMGFRSRRGTDFYQELESFERRMIGRALQLAGGSKRELHRLLQVNRTRSSRS